SNFEKMPSERSLGDGGPEAFEEAIDEHGQEEIQGQDDDETRHERLGGRLADSLGAGAAVEAAMAADERNRRAEEDRLEQTDIQVHQADMPPGVQPVVMGIYMVDMDRDERPAENPHEVGDDGQQGDQEDAGQQSRHHQVVDRVGAQASESVDLLGDAHGAQLSRHGAADPAGQHGGG